MEDDLSGSVGDDPFNPFSMLSGLPPLSFSGGDSGPAFSEGRVGSGGQAGGLFSPVYFGGSGGGLSTPMILIAVVAVIWLLKRK